MSCLHSSRYGRFQTKRETTGNVQPNLFLLKIRDLLVPPFSKDFQTKVEKAVTTALQILSESRSLYHEAKQTLLRTLGLEDWQPPEALTYECKAGDVFAAGRLDAEHFQPKYDELIQRLLKISDLDLLPIKDFSKRLKYGTSEKLVYQEEGIPFLRIADLDNKRFNTQSVQYVSEKQALSISERVSLGDVLVSRSGTLGVAVPIIAPFDNAIFGSYFIRTRPDPGIVNPEYMSLFINSFAGQLQVQQKSTGGVQTNLTIEAIENIIIPIGDLGWQQGFVDLVEQSLAARKQARSLLDQAKHAVEIAIEETETTAMEFLKQSQMRPSG